MAQGDEGAFRKIFHLHWDNIYGVSLMLTKSPALAEDMVQEIFVKVWVKREQLTQVENFSSFIFIIARNHIFDTLRKKSREQAFTNELIKYFKASPNNPEQELLQKESKRLLQQAVDSLPEQQRIVYNLSREKGLRQDEIAEELGISRNTVRNHMARALQKMKEYIERNSEGLLLLVCLIEAMLPT